MIDSLEQGPEVDTSVLLWSNHSFSRKTCPERQLNETKSKMVNAKQSVTNQFAKTMGAEFHVSKVNSFGANFI